MACLRALMETEAQHSDVIWSNRTLQAMAEPWRPPEPSCTPLCAGVLAHGSQGFSDACTNFVPLSSPLNHVLNSVETFQWPRQAWRGPLSAFPGRCLDRLAHIATALTKPLVEPLSAALEIVMFKGIILLSPVFSFVSLPPNRAIFHPKWNGLSLSEQHIWLLCATLPFLSCCILCRRMMNDCRAK